MIETEVAVVGGGPAGAAAAIVLARAGHQVTVFDRARFPRDKVCGDGLTAAALRMLCDLGVDPTGLESWRPTHDIVIRAPSGREQHFGLPQGEGIFAAAARRIDLDAAILEQAALAGAVVHDGAGVAAVAPGSDGTVELSVDGIGAVRAGHVVAADGMWSPVRRHLGLAVDGYRGDAHAFRQYFVGVGPRAEHELYVSFEADLLPGYFWSFPLPGGGANVGFGIHRGHRYSVREMAAVWPDLLARPHVRAVLGRDAVAEGPRKAWPIPTCIGRLPLSGLAGRVLFVGDAAGAVDAMSGEGIGQALQTGSWAAEAIIVAGAGRPEVAARYYRSLVASQLGPDHRMSSWLVAMLSGRRGADLAVGLAGLSPWTRRNFARWLFEDEPRGILLTPGRWHRKFLHRPAAFAGRQP